MPGTAVAPAPIRITPALPARSVGGVMTLPLPPKVRIGAGNSDKPLEQLSAEQRRGNRVLHQMLVIAGALPESYRKREDWDDESTEKLGLVQAALGIKSDGWAEISRPGRPSRRPIVIEALATALRAGKVFSEERLDFVKPSERTTAPTDTSEVAPTQIPTKMSADAPTESKPSTDPKGPKRFVFPENPHALENWEGQRDMRAALGIEYVDNRDEIKKVDAEIKRLCNFKPSDPRGQADVSKQIADLREKRQKLVDEHGTQPGKEGIMGGVHAWQEGRGLEGTGEIISGGIQTVPAAVMWLSDGVTQMGAMARDWARTERKRLTVEGHGEINGAVKIGLYVVEGFGTALDFACNIHDAKWYQWLLPTMWVSGLLYLFGKVGVFLGHIVGGVFEALFDGLQALFGSKDVKDTKDPKAPKAEEEKRILTVQIDATRAEIKRMDVAKKTAAQEDYVQKLTDLLAAREVLKTMLETPKAYKKRQIAEQRDTVNAWRQIADDLRRKIGEPETAATAKDVKAPPAPTPTPDATSTPVVATDLPVSPVSNGRVSAHNPPPPTPAEM